MNTNDYIYFQLGNCFVDASTPSLHGYDILNDRKFSLKPSALTKKLIRMKDTRLLIAINEIAHIDILKNTNIILINKFKISSVRTLNKLKEEYPEYFI